VPIGAHAVLEGDELVMTAYVGTVDGLRSIRLERRGPSSAPEQLGADVAAALRAAGADDILAEVRGGASWDTTDPTQT
jgi:hydroxymethylbilane synthase